MELYVSDDFLIEYIFGTIGLIIGFIISYNMSLINEVVIRWTMLWFSRKIALNMYKSYKRKYNIKNRRFVLYPNPKIIF